MSGGRVSEHSYPGGWERGRNLSHKFINNEILYDNVFLIKLFSQCIVIFFSIEFFICEQSVLLVNHFNGNYFDNLKCHPHTDAVRPAAQRVFDPPAV